LDVRPAGPIGSRRAALVVALVSAFACAISVLARIAILSSDVSGVLLVFGHSDAYETWRDAQLEGHRFPYFDPPGFAYPPIIGYLAGLISMTVTSPRGYLIGWAIVIVLAGGVIGYLLAREAGPRRALLWALAPQLVLTAGINFDVLAAMLATVSALLARRSRVGASLAVAAVATATKFFAAAYAPLLVLREYRRGLGPAAMAAAAFAITLAAVWLPAAVAPYSQLRFTGQYAYGLAANPDSIWILPALLIGAAGLDANSLILLITTAGMGITYFVLVVPRALRAADPVVGFALAVATILLWNRFYSPQYAIWLLPFFALLPLRTRTFALLTVADLGVFFTIFPMTLVLRPPEPLLQPFLAALAVALVLRHIALIVFWRDVAALAPQPASHR
jgi:hypothetical protein